MPLKLGEARSLSDAINAYGKEGGRFFSPANMRAFKTLLYHDTWDQETSSYIQSDMSPTGRRWSIRFFRSDSNDATEPQLFSDVASVRDDPAPGELYEPMSVFRSAASAEKARDRLKAAGYFSRSTGATGA